MISETSGTGGYTTSTGIAKSRRNARGGRRFIYNRRDGVSLVIFFLPPPPLPPSPINATSRRRRARVSETIENSAAINAPATSKAHPL